MMMKWLFDLIYIITNYLVSCYALFKIKLPLDMWLHVDWPWPTTFWCRDDIIQYILEEYMQSHEDYENLNASMCFRIKRLFPIVFSANYVVDTIQFVKAWIKFRLCSDCSKGRLKSIGLNVLNSSGVWCGMRMNLTDELCLNQHYNSTVSCQ